MASQSTGSLDVTPDGNDFVDEYGDLWCYVADDMRGNVAVVREDGDRSGVVSGNTLYARSDGDTFDVNNPDEFIVVDGQWERN